MNPFSELFTRRHLFRQPNLGPLEADVLRVLWSQGESSVRDVLAQLDRPLAYTTVMTTLDRLFKKGLLDRYKAERSFRYLPSRRSQSDLSDGAARELLISHLLDTVCEYDETLLDELERNIAERRRQIESQPAPHGKDAE
jgi:predicted transcriptional regulator